MCGRLGLDWNRRRIEARHECGSLHAAKPYAGTGTHWGTPVAGGVVDGFRDADRDPARDSDCAQEAAEQARAGERKHHSDNSQPCTVWILAAGSVAWGPGGSAGNSGAHALRTIADYPKHLLGNSGSGRVGGGSRTRDGIDGVTVVVSGRTAAGGERDSFRSTGGDRYFGGAGDDRGGDRGRRSRGIYFSRAGDGRQSRDSCGSDSIGNSGPARGLWRGMGGKAAEAAMSRFGVTLGLAVLCGISLLSCSRSHADSIVVGSKNFTESFILGELIAQQIEAHTNLKVERRFYLAGTYICEQAMLGGRIDVYPEYTGTALTTILKQGISGEKLGVYQRVKAEYERQYNLTLGPSFGFNDTFAMEIR